MKKEDIDYFKKGIKSNIKFFHRFKEPIDFNNHVVLDIGCGWGSLCHDIANRGAKKVIGVDPELSRVNFAQEYLKREAPELNGRVIFYHGTISDHLEELCSSIDVIVSKDSFEHIINLENEVERAFEVLKPGGLLFAGFGPLYNSPYGDHKATNAKLPWFHLILPERFLLKRLNKKRNINLKSITDLGLNKLKLSEYKKIFNSSKFNILSFETNRSVHPVSYFFRILACIPFCEEYFTQSIYVILQKPK